MSAIAGIESVLSGSGMNALSDVGSLADVSLPGVGDLGGIGTLPDSGSLTLGGPTGAIGTSAVKPGAGADGANSFAQILDRVSAVEQDANAKGVALATGQLTNVHEFTAAAAQARLAVQMTAAVRNRALDAFSEVMRMPL